MIFCLVWFYKLKNNQINFLKKKPTDFGSVQFFKTKTDSNRFGSVFSGLTRFFSSFFGSVQFSFFSFRLIKPKPNRSIFSKF
jgi:hypothetical protein